MSIRENLPSGWRVSTETERNITVHNSSNGKTITAVRNNSMWSVKGLVGFESESTSEYPVFGVVDSLAAAKKIIVGVVDGGVEEIPVKGNKVCSEDKTGEEIRESNSQTEKDTESMTVDSRGQATLTMF